MLAGLVHSFVLDDDGVLVLHEKDSLLDDDAVSFVCEDREGVEPEPGLEQEALRMGDSGITIG